MSVRRVRAARGSDRAILLPWTSFSCPPAVVRAYLFPDRFERVTPDLDCSDFLRNPTGDSRRCQDVCESLPRGVALLPSDCHVLVHSVASVAVFEWSPRCKPFDSCVILRWPSPEASSARHLLGIDLQVRKPLKPDLPKGALQVVGRETPDGSAIAGRPESGRRRIARGARGGGSPIPMQPTGDRAQPGSCELSRRTEVNRSEGRRSATTRFLIGQPPAWVIE